MKKMFLIVLLAISASASFSREVKMDTPSYSHPCTINGNGVNQIIDIFRSIDVNILQSDNEAVIKEYFRGKNAEILAYIQQRYPQNGVIDQIDPSTNSATVFGLVCAMYEANNFQPFSNGQAVSQKLPGWLQCTFGVLGAASGVPQIISELGTFTWGSTWSIVKFVVKKYGLGWFATMGALYEIATECF